MRQNLTVSGVAMRPLGPKRIVARLSCMQGAGGAARTTNKQWIGSFAYLPCHNCTRLQDFLEERRKERQLHSDELAAVRDKQVQDGLLRLARDSFICGVVACLA